MIVSPKKVVTVHDICTLGRCSTVTATAVLAACGVQPCPVVSAILSSTVDYGRFYEQDTMEAVEGCVPYLQQFLGQPGAIYTGYLGGPSQVEKVLALAEALKGSDTLLIVDPVLGDNGALYPTFDQTMVQEMARLAHRAHLLMPNATEARLLAGIPLYQQFSPQEMAALARSLAQPGQSLVITGAWRQADTLTTLCLEGSTGKLYALTHPCVEAHYPGSGDLFASLVTGRLMAGDSLPQAVRQACGFVCQLMEEAFLSHAPSLEGLPYEPWLHRLHQPDFHNTVHLEELP